MLPCSGREIIRYGVLDRFRTASPREAPAPRAIFTSNPLRGLDWLLDLWRARIRSAVPQAELRIYAGGAVYGHTGTPCAADGRGPGLRRLARRFRRPPLCAPKGAEDHAPGRPCMLCRGDPGETFCLALAEPQAMGVPAVVKPLGSTPERVIDGVTGRVTKDDDGFVGAAVALLRDDELRRRRHLASLDPRRALSWDSV